MWESVFGGLIVESVKGVVNAIKGGDGGRDNKIAQLKDINKRLDYVYFREDGILLILQKVRNGASITDADRDAFRQMMLEELTVTKDIAQLMTLTLEGNYDLSARTKDICNGRFAKKHGIREAIRRHVMHHVTMDGDTSVEDVLPIISDIEEFNNAVDLAQLEVRSALQQLTR